MEQQFLINMSEDEFFERLKECFAEALFAPEPNEGVRVKKCLEKPSPKLSVQIISLLENGKGQTRQKTKSRKCWTFLKSRRHQEKDRLGNVK